MNLFNMSALAEAADAAATAENGMQTNAAAGSMISSIIMILVMVAIFYFMLIRPQRKKDKAVKDMLAALKPGDRICTIGGFYGTIISIKDKDETVTLSMGSLQNTVVVARWAIRSVENVKTENDSAMPEV